MYHYYHWRVSVVLFFTFQESERAVSKEEGMALAQEHRCLFLECSAKTRENVQQCFKDLSLKVLIYDFYTSVVVECWYSSVNGSCTSTMNVFNIWYIREAIQETEFACKFLPKWHLWSPISHSSVLHHTTLDSKFIYACSLFHLCFIFLVRNDNAQMVKK